MEIKAKCTVDYECAKILHHMGVYRGKNPTKVFIFTSILQGLVLCMYVPDVIAGEASKVSIILLMCIVALAFLSCYRYFISPKKQYKALSRIKNLEYNYTFYDDEIEMESKGEGYNNKMNINYSLVPKVIETPKYVIIIKNGNQAMMVDKSTVVNGTLEELKKKLVSSIKGKYIVSKW